MKYKMNVNATINGSRVRIGDIVDSARIKKFEKSYLSYGAITPVSDDATLTTIDQPLQHASIGSNSRVTNDSVNSKKKIKSAVTSGLINEGVTDGNDTLSEGN